MKRIFEQLSVFAGAVIVALSAWNLASGPGLSPSLTPGHMAFGPALKPVLPSPYFRASLALLGWISAAAGVFDELTGHRPCRERQSTHQALEYLRSPAGLQFHPEVLSSHANLAAEGPSLEHVAQ